MWYRFPMNRSCGQTAYERVLALIYETRGLPPLFYRMYNRRKTREGENVKATFGSLFAHTFQPRSLNCGRFMRIEILLAIALASGRSSFTKEENVFQVRMGKVEFVMGARSRWVFHCWRVEAFSPDKETLLETYFAREDMYTLRGNLFRLYHQDKATPRG